MRNRRTLKLWSIGCAAVALLIPVGVEVPASAVTGASWSTPADVSEAGQSADALEVATSTSGRTQTIVWRRSNGSNYIVQARTSNDYGVTWAAVIDLSASGQDAYQPQVALSADGRYQTITWRRFNGSEDIIQARASNDYGATWAAVADLSAPGHHAYSPQVALSADGRYQTIAWHRGAVSGYIVQVRTSNDYGTTWSGPSDLSATGQDAGEARLAMSTDGSYQTITWYRNNGSAYIVQVRTSNDYGTTWSGPSDLSATGQNAFPQQVAMSTDGRYQTIVWRRFNGSNFIEQTSSSNNYGATWALPFDLSAPGQTADYGQVAMSTDGRHQIITWRRSNGSNPVVQSSSSSDYGATWSAALAMSAAGQDAGSERTAMTSDGQLQFITWARSNGANYIVQVRTSNDFGTTWEAAVDMSTPGQSAFNSRIAVTPDGQHQTMAWTRSNGTNYIVQVSQSGNPTGVTTGSSTRAEFRFVLPDGTECSAISPQEVQVDAMVALPGVDADCRSMPGAKVAGWTIPTKQGSIEYGSDAAPFAPGLSVRVVDSQEFTVVPYEPILSFTYDANVATADTCTSNGVENTTDAGRRFHTWVPRASTDIARFPALAACTPTGFTLAGWNSRGDGTGTNYSLSAPLPADWATAVVNQRTLFAVWKRQAS